MKRALVLLAVVVSSLSSSRAGAQEKGLDWYLEPAVTAAIPILEDDRFDELVVGVGLRGGVWLARFGQSTRMAIELTAYRHSEQGPHQSDRLIVLPTGSMNVETSTFWRRYPLTLGPKIAFPMSANLDMFFRAAGGIEILHRDETVIVGNQDPESLDDDELSIAPMASAGWGLTRKLLGALSGGVHVDVPVIFRDELTLYIDAGITLSLTF